MRRGVITAAKIHQQELQDSGTRYRAALITVTYRQDEGWHPNDIRSLLNCYRTWLNRRGIPARYAWVLELTQRGRPHYHVLLFLPRGITPPKPDKQGWWRKGMSNCKWARRPVGYVAKYASKGTEGDLPANARLWGVAGLRGHGRELFRYGCAPTWLRAFSTPGDVLRRVGAWWENRTTGIAYRSPWILDNFWGNSQATFAWVGWTEEAIRFLGVEPCGA